MSRALTVPLDGGPYALTVGPDGAMWVTLVHSGHIARVPASGSAADVALYPVGPDTRPSIITTGPDGALWFTRTGDDRIGRITVTGEMRAFDLPEPPRRIEVYDNSHIQGSNPVGGMIVSGPDGFIKSQYRKFNIRTDEIGSDDFAMMREVLTRRFSRLLKE